MKSDMLCLECDNLVIGAGLAGMAAALRLKGKTLVASAGLGATAISGGAIALPERRDEEAERWFLKTLQDTCCPYREGQYMTDMRAVRSGLVQTTTDFMGSPVYVSPDDRPLNDGIALGLKVFAGRSCQEVAHMIEADDAWLDLIGEALSNAGADSYLLPPVLGVSRAMQARKRLENAAGAPVYEYVTAPSVLGLRLLRGLRDALDRNRDITLLETTTIESIDGGARGLMGTKRLRGVLVEASLLVLATGGPLTGFRLDGDRVCEPLTGTVVGDVEADLGRSFAADHPLMFKGIGVCLPAAGGFRDVRAAGAVAAGYGLYEALRTGYHAGDGL
ncbi:MAG: anaerobic glycerol-3-phosphate dehydrogenase subunit B [Methanocella sp. PtaU1.Bin125]|nr:MAG: anaerobic glycerol-3-phosphate dehydrogenase subunit B [Methanocella sp. PtaU1.Bin125]